MERKPDRPEAGRAALLQERARRAANAPRRDGDAVALVPVAAVLVAGIRLHFLDVRQHSQKPGPNIVPCDAPLRNGAEMGWFEHVSTIIVFAPGGYTLCDAVREGTFVRVGQPLLRLPRPEEPVRIAHGPRTGGADPAGVN